ncbi:MAG: hypothetical protein GF350_09440 [Chitinivibrionales bacterium]|nr:hypothetical protein [Chitinivibrionales bacterium]
MKVIKHLPAFSIYPCIILLCTCVFSYSRFSNFGSTITINDMLIDDNILWAATTGGLFILDTETGDGDFVSDIEKFPDLNLSSLCKGPGGNLWIASNQGYLTKIEPDDNFNVYTSYVTSGWKINDISSYGSYLVIASSRGCSIFNPGKKTRPEAVKNAQKIGTFESPVVNIIALHDSVLYLGCENGFASLDSGETILGSNFFDQSIWDTRETDKPVIDWVIHNNSLQAMSMLATSFKSRMVHAEGKKIYANNSETLELPSEVIALISDGDRYCWIGTAEHYFYRWDGGDQLTQFEIRGLKFKYINQIHVDHKGMLWLIPAFSKPVRWYERITRYDGSTWQLMDHEKRLGSIAQHFRVAMEDRDGDMWFPTFGNGIHHYSYSDDSWSMVKHGSGIVTAMAQDSSGYYWFGNNYAREHGYTGCLFCYDSEEDTYAEFLTEGKSYFDNIYSLCVDSRGKILAGGLGGGFVVFSHNGSPLEGPDAITSLKNDFSPMATVYDMINLGNDTTWLAAGKGLYLYNSASNSIEKFDNISSELRGVDIESDSILYLASRRGVIRYNLMDSSETYLTVADGLVSNTVTDISVDRHHGCLWIATSEGLSRYDLGHEFARVESNEGLFAYPNPYKLSDPDHNQIFFENLAPKTRVYLYDITGKIISEAVTENKTDYEWSYSLVPPRNIVPGTYYFVAHLGGKSDLGKLLILP